MSNEFNEKNYTSNKRQTFTSAGLVYAAVLMIATVSLENLDFVDFKKISPEIGTSILIVFFGFYKDFLRVTNFQKYILLSFVISMLVYSSLTDSSNIGIIYNLNGFLGIYELSSIGSFIFTFIFYLSVINAINRFGEVQGYLIFFCLSFFVSMLYINFLNELHTLNTLSIILIGISIFFIYNNYIKKNIILIGHSGSLFMGFWIAYFLICYISMAPNSNLVSIFSIKLENVFIIALSIINIAVIDTIRVIIMRIIRRKSPFSDDDRWHLHHILLDTGMSKLRTSLILTFINCFNCILIFLLEPNFNSNELIIIFIIIGIIWFSFFQHMKTKNINFL